MTLEQDACPYLGLAQDSATRLTFPSAAHRCRAGRTARTIDLEHQQTFCLGGTYRFCNRYRPPRREDAGYPFPRPVDHEPPRLADGRIDRATLAGRFVRRVIVLLLVIMVLAIVGLGVIRIAALVIPANVGNASPTPLQAPVLVSPAPTPTPSSSPTASPTASPTPTPRAYVVRRGDTLGSIAARFGTTVQAIKNANKLKNSTIKVGQKLVIPPAP